MAELPPRGKTPISNNCRSYLFNIPFSGHCLWNNGRTCCGSPRFLGSGLGLLLRTPTGASLRHPSSPHPPANSLPVPTLCGPPGEAAAACGLYENLIQDERASERRLSPGRGRLLAVAPWPPSSRALSGWIWGPGEETGSRLEPQFWIVDTENYIFPRPEGEYSCPRFCPEAALAEEGRRLFRWKPGRPPLCPRCRAHSSRG